jgi:hypothetical protein
MTPLGGDIIYTNSDGKFETYYSKDGGQREEEIEVRVSWEGNAEYKESTKTITFIFPKTGLPCIIATATYGSPYASEVVYMRHVRDDLIGSNDVGKILVTGWNRFYYLWSPPIAHSISGSPPLRSSFTILLLPLLGSMHIVAFVFESIAVFSPELASIISFLTAAVLATSIYILIPIILVKSLIRKIKQKHNK